MMSDGENNENTQKEEVPMETAEDAGTEEKLADVSTESKEEEEGEDGDVGDTGTGEEEEEPSGADTSTDSPSKETPIKDSQEKKNTVKKTPKKVLTSEDEEDDEERLGLLERPVIIESGKREKRKVERLEMTTAITPSSQKKIEVHEGSGTKLGECPRIEQRLQKIRGEDLKTLHKVLFGRVGAANIIKKNIRQFSGFPFKKDDKEHDRKMVVLGKLNLSVLKGICDVLDVERGGTKDSIVNRLMEFLLSPRSSGKKVPAPKRKRKSSGKGDKSAEKPKKKKKAVKKAEKKLADDIELSESEEESEGEEPDGTGDAHPDSEPEEEEEEDSEEEEAPKKKKQKVEKTPKKQKETKEAKKKKEKPEKKAKEKPEKEVKQKKEKSEKKEKKAASPKKKVSKVEVDSSDEDEPLSKKQSNEPPSDEEVKDCIKKILEGANLEEVTMKTVLKQVYDTYPDFDLSDRKTFIKNTVKQCVWLRFPYEPDVVLSLACLYRQLSDGTRMQRQPVIMPVVNFMSPRQFQFTSSDHLTEFQSAATWEEVLRSTGHG